VDDYALIDTLVNYVNFDDDEEDVVIGFNDL
jgi:hypothetical protein